MGHVVNYFLAYLSNFIESPLLTRIPARPVNVSGELGQYKNNGSSRTYFPPLRRHLDHPICRDSREQYERAPAYPTIIYKPRAFGEPFDVHAFDYYEIDEKKLIYANYNCFHF